MPAITAEKLVREFGAGTRAVDGIDLEVFPGEIYGFLGPNGAGKSTTVLMLTTLLPATDGKATVGGFDIAARLEQRGQTFPIRGIVGLGQIRSHGKADKKPEGRQDIPYSAASGVLGQSRQRVARRSGPTQKSGSGKNRSGTANDHWPLALEPVPQSYYCEEYLNQPGSHGPGPEHGNGRGQVRPDYRGDSGRCPRACRQVQVLREHPTPPAADSDVEQCGHDVGNWVCDEKDTGQRAQSCTGTRGRREGVNGGHPYQRETCPAEVQRPQNP